MNMFDISFHKQMYLPSLVSGIWRGVKVCPVLREVSVVVGLGGQYTGEAILDLEFKKK